MNSIAKTSFDKVLPFQASKWLHFALLVDADELQKLFNVLGDKRIVLLAGVNRELEEIVPEEQFIHNYSVYLNLIKEEGAIAPSKLHKWFTSGISVDLAHFCKVIVGADENIVKIVKPVLQIKPHWFDYSSTDKKIRSDTLSLSNVSWGLQFSYPQIFEDPVTKKIHKVLKEENFPNNILFEILKKWIRENTQATSFIIGEHKLNAPIRISKGCFPWINRHAGLIEKGIAVHV